MNDVTPVRVEIDPDLCVGSAMCVGVDPEGFQIDADGHARYRRAVVDAELASEAAELCPMAAIRLLSPEPGEA